MAAGDENPDDKTTDDTGGGASAGPVVADVFDAEDARAELAGTKALAAEVRQKTFDHYSERTSQLEVERDEQARKAWANRQEANAADMQVKRETATLERAQAHMKNWEKEAMGGDSQALTDYEHSRALAERAQTRIDAAKTRAEQLRAEADVADKEVVRLEDESMKNYEEYHYLADQAESLELRAWSDQMASDDLAKAQDAETRAAELRARGDDKNAEVLEQQAAQLRADADKWVTESRPTVDDEKLEELGIDVDDRYADSDTIVNPIPDPFAPPPDPEPTVIDMEPEIIEGTPPTVINMDPEIIEGTPPTVINMDPEIIEGTPPIEMEPDYINPPEQPVIEMEPDYINPPAQPESQSDFGDDFQSDSSGTDQPEQFDEPSALDG